MQKLLSLLSLFDWIISGTLLSAGIYLDNRWMMLAGAIGLAIAYFAPAKRFHSFIQKRVVTKKVTGSTEISAELNLNDDEFYKKVLGDSEASEQDTPARTYLSPPVPYAGTFIGKSKHNELTQDSLNLFTNNPESRFY